MSLNTDIMGGISLLTDRLGAARSFQELTHDGSDTGSPISADTISTFPEANAEAGIKSGAELLQIAGKPFDTASKDLKTGRWKILSAGGTDVDLEITGRVTGDIHVGYEVLINPKGARTRL